MGWHAKQPANKNEQVAASMKKIQKYEYEESLYTFVTKKQKKTTTKSNSECCYFTMTKINLSLCDFLISHGAV